jgi:hypothetical protein
LRAERAQKSCSNPEGKKNHLEVASYFSKSASRT